MEKKPTYEELEQRVKELDRKVEIFKPALENVDVGITRISSDFEIEWVNPVVLSWFGESLDELVGRKCYKAFEQKDEICGHCPAVKAMETGQPVEAETIGEKPDGTRFLVRDKAFPLYNKDGEIIGFNEIVEDIGERNQTEEALHQYKHIVSSSTDMLALLDKRFSYLAANKAYMEAFELTPEQLIGNTVINVFGEEFFNTVIKPKADRCLGDEEVNYQDWFDFPAFERRFMDITYYPYYSEDKKIIGFVVNGRNITERKRGEEALKESEARYRDLVGLSPDPIVILQGDLYRFVNSAFTKAFGYSQQDVDNGLSFFELVQESDKEAVSLRYNDRLEGNHLTPTFLRY